MSRNVKLTRTLKWTLLLMACAGLAGCVHPNLGNSHRLIQRPDFPAAAWAAPEWCRDALKTINELEMQIEGR